MRIGLPLITPLLIALSQTACVTTLHTDHHPKTRTVYVEKTRPVYVPVPRPQRTIVTVRRY